MVLGSGSGPLNTLPFKVPSAATSGAVFDFTDEVSFYEARDVPAAWLCSHPRPLLSVSSQSRQKV